MLVALNGAAHHLPGGVERLDMWHQSAELGEMLFAKSVANWDTISRCAMVET